MPLDSLESSSPLLSPFSYSSSGSMNNIPSISGSEHNSSVDGLSSNIHSNSSQIYISSGSSSEKDDSETSYIPKHIRTKKVFKHSKQHPPDPEDLPPCRVCGERASGLHYGVNTCEPCKVSFYQQLSLNDMFQRHFQQCVSLNMATSWLDEVNQTHRITDQLQELNNKVMLSEHLS